MLGAVFESIADIQRKVEQAHEFPWTIHNP